jgi:hypothetical protein
MEALSYSIIIVSRLIFIKCFPTIFFEFDISHKTKRQSLHTFQVIPPTPAVSAGFFRRKRYYPFTGRSILWYDVAEIAPRCRGKSREDT